MRKVIFPVDAAEILAKFIEPYRNSIRRRQPWHGVEVEKSQTKPRSPVAIAVAVPGNKPTKTVSADEVARKLHLIGEDENSKIWIITRNDKLSVNEKMQELVKIKIQCDGYTSIIWAELLSVSSAAVRKTAFWKNRERRKWED